MAQWSIVPQVKLGYLSYSYETPNPYLYEKGSGVALGSDVLARYNFNETFAVDGGIGIRYHNCKDSVEKNKITYAPIFVGVKWGHELFLEGHMGYNLPLNSNGLGYVTGWFARIGAGIGSDDVSLGASVDILHLFGSKTLSYVPKGYLPVSSGYGLCVYLEYRIPIDN